MKLWYSFKKELQLASKSFYFYIEIFMAIIFLALLLFVIPENFTSSTTEYVYLDLPEAYQTFFIEAFTEDDLDGEVEKVEVKVLDQEETFDYYESEDKKVYVVDSVEQVKALADKKRKLGAVISLKDGELAYDYYLQGYESEKLRNLYKVIHNNDFKELEEVFNAQKTMALTDGFEGLTDRENVLPSFLTFNGSLMGVFIIAAYIFLDKKEGIITAYAVTAAPVQYYLLSKLGVVTVTSLATSLLMVIPIMGLQPNYLMLIIFLICSGFFASSLGLLLSSFYDNIMQGFGVLYALIMVFLLPNIAYFIPSWNPEWVKVIPSYYFLESFKETLLPSGDVLYVVYTSAAFLVLGIGLFFLSSRRFKKTLSL